jgi:hypothetical protein
MLLVPLDIQGYKDGAIRPYFLALFEQLWATLGPAPLLHPQVRAWENELRRAIHAGPAAVAQIDMVVASMLPLHVLVESADTVPCPFLTRGQDPVLLYPSTSELLSKVPTVASDLGMGTQAGNPKFYLGFMLTGSKGVHCSAHFARFARLTCLTKGGRVAYLTAFNQAKKEICRAYSFQRSKNKPPSKDKWLCSTCGKSPTNPCRVSGDLGNLAAAALEGFPSC